MAATAGVSQVFGLPNILKAAAPNERLNVAGIGVGGQGAGDLAQCAATENIVALADVDSQRAAPTFQRYEKASKYVDFRKMLDKEAKNIDAVVIATPDHMHATAALWCMERGKHVYVEKPLTRTPWEARLLTRAAAKYKVATQMGNQGYSHPVRWSSPTIRRPTNTSSLSFAKAGKSNCNPKECKLPFGEARVVEKAPNGSATLDMRPHRQLRRRPDVQAG